MTVKFNYDLWLQISKLQECKGNNYTTIRFYLETEIVSNTYITRILDLRF